MHRWRTLSPAERNVRITVLCVAAAVICALTGHESVAVALITFLGGLWMHSGREAKTLVVLLLALSACQPAQSGFTAEIGARIGQVQSAPQNLTMSPLAGGISVGRVELKPDSAPTCTSGYACLYANSSDNLLYTVDAGGTALKMHAAQSFRTSANCSALSSPTQGDVCYDTGLGVFRFRDGSGWTTAATNGSLYVTLAGVQTITGAKTFSAATVFNGAVTLGDAAADIVTNKGTLRIDNTANTFYVSLTHAASANRAITLPDAAGQLLLNSRTINTTAPITGGGDLSADRTIALSIDSSLQVAGGSLGVAAGSLVYARHTGGAIGAIGAVTVYLAAPGVAGSATELHLSLATRSSNLKRLYCRLDTAPGGADTVVITARKNAVDQALTCTITGAATTCNDTSNTVPLAAADRVSTKAVSSGLLAAGLVCSMEETN